MKLYRSFIRTSRSKEDPRGCVLFIRNEFEKVRESTLFFYFTRHFMSDECNHSFVSVHSVFKLLTLLFMVVPKSDSTRMEHYLRQGKKKLELFQSPNVKRISTQ
jgi:hypothetical protein